MSDVPPPNTGPLPPPVTTPPPPSPTPPPPPNPFPPVHQPPDPSVRHSTASPVNGGEVRPKLRWVWLSVAVTVVGCAAAVAVGVLGFVGIANSVDDFERVQRGSGDIQIVDPGEYVVYSEERTRSIGLTVTSPDGEPVTTNRYLNEITYDFGGRSGTAALTFEARSAGTYTVQTDTDVAVGPSIASSLVRTIVFPFVIGGLSVVVGLVMLAVTLVRRSKSKQRGAIS